MFLRGLRSLDRKYELYVTKKREKGQLSFGQTDYNQIKIGEPSLPKFGSARLYLPALMIPSDRPCRKSMAPKSSSDPVHGAMAVSAAAPTSAAAMIQSTCRHSRSHRSPPPVAPRMLPTLFIARAREISR